MKLEMLVKMKDNCFSLALRIRQHLSITNDHASFVLKKTFMAILRTARRTKADEAWNWNNELPEMQSCGDAAAQ